MPIQAARHMELLRILAELALSVSANARQCPIISRHRAYSASPVCPREPAGALSGTNEGGSGTHAAQVDRRLAPAQKPPATGRIEVHDADCRGLVLRLTAGGAATWVLRMRTTDGRETRVSLGSYPAMGLRAARDAAEVVRGRIKAGARSGSREAADARGAEAAAGGRQRRRRGDGRRAFGRVAGRARGRSLLALVAPLRGRGAPRMRTSSSPQARRQAAARDDASGLDDADPGLEAHRGDATEEAN